MTSLIATSESGYTRCEVYTITKIAETISNTLKTYSNSIIARVAQNYHYQKIGH